MAADLVILGVVTLFMFHNILTQKTCHTEMRCKVAALILTILSFILLFILILQEYKKEFPDIPIGYSGHESGQTITIGAVAIGAKVIERHITMDKTWKGSDHEASLGS